MTKLFQIAANSLPFPNNDADAVLFSIEDLKRWYSITDAELRQLDDNGYEWQYESYNPYIDGTPPCPETPDAYLFLPYLNRRVVSVSEALSEIRNGRFDRVNVAHRERFICKEQSEEWKCECDHWQGVIDAVTYGMTGFQVDNVIDAISAPKPRRHRTDEMFVCEREWERELFSGKQILQRGHIKGWRVVLLRRSSYGFDGIWWHPKTPRKYIPVTNPDGFK